MSKLTQLCYNSIVFSSRQPSWWLFALMQAAAFSLIGQLARPRPLSGLLSVCLILAIAALSPLTIWLWQNIAAAKEKPPFQSSQQLLRQFFNQSIAGFILISVTVLVILLARSIFPFWPIHTLVFALAASTAGLMLLYVALCRQTLTGAWRLAAATWDKKISFPVMAVLVLLLAHTIAFVLVHGVWGNFYFFDEFSVPGRSATIWVLLTLLMMAVAYFSSVLNCFVVLLFLDSINRKKDPETVKERQKAVSLEPSSAG